MAKNVYFDESMGVEYFVNRKAKKQIERFSAPPFEEQPFYEDSWYADYKNEEQSQSEKDMIYLNKSDRLIQFIIVSALGISLTAFFSLLFWLDSIERIIIRYL